MAYVKQPPEYRFSVYIQRYHSPTGEYCGSRQLADKHDEVAALLQAAQELREMAYRKAGVPLMRPTGDEER